MNNPIRATIDFDKEGIQHGFLRLPYSRDDSAWGAIMIPIAQMQNGSGPTALLTAGNHGDEYEGPTALYGFANRSGVQDLQGRVIVVPAMNYPAFRAGSRVSPIDGGNLNRLFPGSAQGSITEIIADYFTRVLLPVADFVLDIHSGGKSLDFVPFAGSHILEDKTLERQCEQAAQAFGAPYQLKMLELDAQRMYDTQAEAQGKVFVTTELGGGGTTSPQTVEIARRGVDNFLAHAGILRGGSTEMRAASVQLDMPDDRCFVLAEHHGLLEPFFSLGDTVREGQLLASIHTVERTGVAPQAYRASRDGVLIARHVPSLAKVGDTLFVIAQERGSS